MAYMPTRREFMAGTAAVISGMGGIGAFADTPSSSPLPFPLIDLHVHLDNSTIDAVLPLATERKVKFGIVEHAGTRENVYPTVLSNDEELLRYLAMLEGKPVWKGVQAEWTDWMGCFSKGAALKLDYVLTDTLTFPDPEGKRMKLWERTDGLGSAQEFMDRYVDWHLKIMEEQPVDILANVSWLPAPYAENYDALWTDARIGKVIDTAKKQQVAIEISSGFQLPKLHFLQIAKDAGIKFSFGSNGRYPKMGLLEYSVKLARELALTADHLFVPGKGAKAVERRWPK